jgi:hypothetical protein
MLTLLQGKPADLQAFLDSKLRGDVTFHLQPVAKEDIVSSGGACRS